MLFENTIFDDRYVVVQKEFFQYASITVPLSLNPNLTIKVWEMTIKRIGKMYDTGSMWDTDLE